MTFAPGDKLLRPKRADVLERLFEILQQLLSETVENSLEGNGYIYEEGIDYSFEMQSDANGE